MRFQLPTMLRLILLGFFLVSVPLVVAIVTAIAQVDRLARESRSTLVSVQENTVVSRTLADRVAAMEESAVQFQALLDPSYKQIYDENRAEVLNLLDRLVQDSTNPELLRRLSVAREAVEASHATVTAIADGSAPANLAAVLDTLRQSVLEVVQQQNAVARGLANAMLEQANRLQRTLVIQAGLVIPLSIGLAVLFVAVIVRPLRQIDRSIHALGRGTLTESVPVAGTRDLEELGRRLEWLRLRLLELEAEKSRFLRNVTHELKTPLTNIREAAELLLDAGDTAPESQAITKILRDNSLRLQQMIEKLLYYGAAGDIGEQELRESVQFDLLVNDVLERYADTTAARNVTLRRMLEPVTVTGNTRRLTAVVDNLVSNAVKYTPDRGEIEIELSKRNGVVTLNVRDNGPGVPESARPHVFDWFYTGPRPPQWKVAGTGMGLAIAREYARHHDGDIVLLDSAQGAHFQMTLGTDRRLRPEDELPDE
ncbi:MAG TPA: HAMP domain-containing sensor histidine kinase [Woeseiaceae bacterium]|nr:HAMP domain-containing sensor histidine kinase [Woeseiaceae bacterium]